MLQSDHNIIKSLCSHESLYDALCTSHEDNVRFGLSRARDVWID